MINLKSVWTLSLYILQLLLVQYSDGLPCALRKYQHGYVCVCNSTYCDSYEKMTPDSRKGTFMVVTSSISGEMFELDRGKFVDTRYVKKDKYKFVDVTINKSRKIQTVVGFGGALTGAVVYNLNLLSDELQHNLYRSYYSPTHGIGYDSIRVPIGGCDFDLQPWAYNEHPQNDKLLSNFTSLDKRDVDLVSHIRKIQIHNPTPKIMGAAWSPPRWMKTNNQWSGSNILKFEYYQTWADYHLKYLELMDAANVTFWAISTGNEPLNAIVWVYFVKFMNLGWMPELQAQWVEENLGPTIRGSKFKDVKIFAGDDQRFTFPWWFERMNATHPKAMEFIDAFAVHWYTDMVVPPSVLQKTHKLFPDKIILNTESCIGDKPLETHGVVLGSWVRGEMYASAIIIDLNNCVNGWIDWNLALDEQGGPNYVNNFVSSPITVNATSKMEFYKEPIFYVLGHFSKFILPGSRVIESIVSSSDTLQIVACLRPDGYTVVVIHNRNPETVYVNIGDAQRSQHGVISKKLLPRSINTFVYV